MANHNDTGKQGEILAAVYLEKAGYSILHSNWRYRHWEVDIIASNKAVLHFIEVKTRTSAKYGYPEDKVDRKKIRYLIDASAQYLHLHPQWKRVQFDILSITITTNSVDYFLIEDVYL